ncbi:MAG: hypothetical protein K0S47_4504, partial [Herbinix sp.]|nr:hypothetical protein [Herbinix sp.]
MYLNQDSNELLRFINTISDVVVLPSQH